MGAGALVALSNDQFTWVERPYAPSQTWTLASGDGSKTIAVKWRDGSGHSSPVQTKSVVLDMTAPSVSGISWSLITGSALASGRVPVRVAWTATDATSGVHDAVTQLSIDGGPYASDSTITGASALVRTLLPGHTYRFRVRAVDNAGNPGAWAYGSAFKLSGIQQTSSAVHDRGTWATTRSTSWWGGSARCARTSGATVSHTFTGRSIAWVGLKASTRGKAKVYVNGVFKATVDLYTATTKKQAIVWSANYSTVATRTITIKVLGTSGRPRVDIDGFVVAR